MTTSVYAQSAPLTLAYQLTYSRNLDPAISPDGRTFVYINIIEGREQLFIMNIRCQYRWPGYRAQMVARWRALYFPVCVRSDFGRSCEIFVAQPALIPLTPR